MNCADDNGKDGFTPTTSHDALVFQVCIELVERALLLQGAMLFCLFARHPSRLSGYRRALENASVRKKGHDTRHGCRYAPPTAQLNITAKPILI
jgi:hypothetical protein